MFQPSPLILRIYIQIRAPLTPSLAPRKGRGEGRGDVPLLKGSDLLPHENGIRDRKTDRGDRNQQKDIRHHDKDA